MQSPPKKPYQILLDKMKAAYAAGCYHETVWLAYVVLEDRLASALRMSGGTTVEGKGPIQALGPKLGELGIRRERDPLLGQHFPAQLLQQIQDWKQQREALLQAKADFSDSYLQIEKDALQLAQRGIALANLTCTATRQFKKQRAQLMAA